MNPEEERPGPPRLVRRGAESTSHVAGKHHAGRQPKPFKQLIRPVRTSLTAGEKRLRPKTV
jgi:hypothetical protein